MRKIVYSTCSIHATENEHVVLESLRSEEARAGPFSLASPNEVLPQWPRRGLSEEMGPLSMSPWLTTYFIAFPQSDHVIQRRQWCDVHQVKTPPMASLFPVLSAIGRVATRGRQTYQRVTSITPEMSRRREGKRAENTMP